MLVNDDFLSVAGTRLNTARARYSAFAPDLSSWTTLILSVSIPIDFILMSSSSGTLSVTVTFIL